MESLKPAINLIKENPDLVHRLVDATTREERAALLAEYGVELPDPEALKAQIKELATVAGGGTTVTNTTTGIIRCVISAIGGVA